METYWEYLILVLKCNATQNYFGFVVDKFSELRHVLDSCVISWSLLVEVSSRQKNSWEFLYRWSKLFFHNPFSFPNKHQILSVSFDVTFNGNSGNNFDYRRAIGIFETVSGSLIKTLAILWHTSLGNSSTTIPQQLLESLGNSKETSHLFIRFERSFFSQFEKYL